MDVPLIRIALTQCHMPLIFSLAVALPGLHLFKVGLPGEEKLYKAHPFVPACAMVLSMIIATFYYEALRQDPPPYATPHSNIKDKCNKHNKYNIPYQNPFISIQ